MTGPACRAVLLTVALWAGTPGTARPQLPLPPPDWMRLGRPWSGPNTCVAGPAAASAILRRGGDPNAVFFGTPLPAKDSAALTPLWSRVRECVTTVPGMAEREGALIAIETDGIITKLIYGFGGKAGAGVMERWHRQITGARGPETARGDGSRGWTTDTLDITVVPASDFWFGAVTVHVRTRGGCQWLIRAAARAFGPADRPPACW